MSVRVAGVGQGVAGDDAVGLLTLEALRAQALPPGVELTEVRDPAELVELSAGARHLIVIDALLDEREPGKVRVLEPADLDPNASPVSTHGLGVARALALAERIHPNTARRVEIVAIGIRRPQRFEISLSEPVRAAVPEAVRIVRKLLES